MKNKVLVIIATMMLYSYYSSAQSIPIQLMVVDQNGFEMPNTQVKLRLTMRGDTSNHGRNRYPDNQIYLETKMYRLIISDINQSSNTVILAYTGR